MPKTRPVSTELARKSHGAACAINEDEVTSTSNSGQHHNEVAQPIHVAPSPTMKSLERHFQLWQNKGKSAHPNLRKQSATWPPELYISTNLGAGVLANQLANLLRKYKASKVKLSNSRGILKVLRVLAITQDFLSQHGSALSFLPSNYRCHGHPTHNPQHQDEQDVPWYTFDLYVKIRNYEGPREVELRPSKPSYVPMFDFSLDARKEWKHKASISEDMSYSLADLLYGQLVEQSNPAGQAEPSAQLVEGEKPFVMDWTTLKCSGPVLMSVDEAQSTTLFMALTLFQKRMKLEGLPLDVTCTVYRNTVAPRLDGRNGFVFKVSTMHRRAAHLKRSHNESNSHQKKSD
ncbi:hypothetical protein CEUSTIGMA_g11282.t1 [Chlamydomonas eustigma]|uniref:Uncharacterized protein n=1 Tax=Chlamydomonas eustigma TaxID=1157962 RepID=A0A250XLA9_9CHLO|nr:hypothetical protein CEUSTIGMA_g11282.t1 [Chlamydomonas eustigma]|eukprot:GAX83857.1 hypothetical protein CEUSTIGMA_g11282.t1 [Chlamydomonas eustigma]